MKPKRRRLYYVLAGMATLGVAAALVLTALQDNLSFFHSPTDVFEKNIPPDRRFQIGGLVVEGSIRVERIAGATFTVFDITDLTRTIHVRYPELVTAGLFAEGEGVVAKGYLDTQGVFIATEVLAKHDSTYIPREVVEALKKSGRWKGPGSEQAGAP